MSNRWWVYQRERFPLFKHGLLIAVLAFASVFYAALLRGSADLPTALAGLTAFAVVFLFFLALRIADEFKDYMDDLRYRPYRPVPRGLVRLHELARLAVVALVVQVALCLALDARLLVPLAATWLYLGLMSKEFFVGTWLKAHPVAYMLSHMLIVPLIVLFATACDWLVAGGRVPALQLGWFLAVSYFGGMVVELGRKIRAPGNEEEGVETYSRLWGVAGATRIWAGALISGTVLACAAARAIGFTLPVAAASLPLLVWAYAAMVRFRRNPGVAGAKRLEDISGFWVLTVYLMLGIAPTLTQYWRAM